MDILFKRRKTIQGLRNILKDLGVPEEDVLVNLEDETGDKDVILRKIPLPRDFHEELMNNDQTYFCEAFVRLGLGLVDGWQISKEKLSIINDGLSANNLMVQPIDRELLMLIWRNWNE